MSFDQAIRLYLWEVEALSEQSTNSLSVDLPLDERDRADLMSPRRRDQFIKGRYLLRNIFLSQYRQPLPADMQLNGHGKPWCKGFPEFNISHTQGWIGVGLAAKGRIGLDIEIESEHRDIHGIAKRYGTPDEISYLRKLNEVGRLSAFCKIWSLKESYVKAMGEGLAANLYDLQFNFNEDRMVKIPTKDNFLFFYTKIKNLHISVCCDAGWGGAPEFWKVSCREGQLVYEKTENIHFKKFDFVVSESSS